MAQLHRHRPDLAGQLPDARKVVAFRNVLVHGYDELDTAQILFIIREHLSLLLRAAGQMLTSLGRIEE